MTKSAILGILHNNSEMLKKHHVKRIGVFGSHARGEQGSGSDIDFLVEFDESSFGANYMGYFDTVSSLSAELGSLLKKDIDLVTIEMLSPHMAPNVLKEVEFLEGI